MVLYRPFTFPQYRFVYEYARHYVGPIINGIIRGARVAWDHSRMLLARERARRAAARDLPLYRRGVNDPNFFCQHPYETVDLDEWIEFLPDDTMIYVNAVQGMVP